jgi:Holliday junction DNA helicase RuvB
MAYYTHDELAQIIKRSSDVFNIQISGEGAFELARRSRGTPRIANRLLRRVRDFSTVKGQKVINDEMVNFSLQLLKIDSMGLDEVDHKILQTMIAFYQGGPVGVNTIAANIGEEVDTIESVYEPYLLQIGFLQRTPRGRVVTLAAYQHLNLPVPDTKR